MWFSILEILVASACLCGAGRLAQMTAARPDSAATTETTPATTAPPAAGTPAERPRAPVPAPPAAHPAHPVRVLLPWRGIRLGESTPEQVRTALGPPSREATDIARGKVSGLQIWTYYGVVPTTVYFRNGRAWLVVLVPTPDSALPALLADWESTLQTKPEVRPSFRGRGVEVRVHAREGVALHAEGKFVQAVELFAATDWPTYQTDLLAPAEPHP